MSESNGYMTPFVGDGYDREATIPGEPGFFSDIRLRYRLMSAEEESLVGAKINMHKDTAPTRFYAEAFAGGRKGDGKILDWDVKDRDGKKLDLTADNICGLSFPAYWAIRQVVCGEVKIGEYETRSNDAKN